MNIGIDLGKYKSYVVMREGRVVVKEGYTETSKEGFEEFFGEEKDANVIVESSSSTNKVANILEGYNVVVANPLKVRIIAESVKKTDKIDAHTLLDLYEKDYLPRSWLPPKEIREGRDLCRNRDFLVRQRTAVKNRIRYQTDLLGINFSNFNKRSIEELKNYPILCTLLKQLESLNSLIYSADYAIEKEVENNGYAKLLYTIPGVGSYGALAIATEIGDVHRFPSDEAIFSYAGLVPRIRQSGNREYRGRIIKGNTFLKTLLVECVQIHIQRCPDSFISLAYYRIRGRRGYNKAKIAAARKLLQVIYLMLMRKEAYLTNE